jgi:hypothetical protein
METEPHACSGCSETRTTHFARPPFVLLRPAEHGYGNSLSDKQMTGLRGLAAQQSQQSADMAGSTGLHAGEKARVFRNRGGAKGGTAGRMSGERVYGERGVVGMENYPYCKSPRVQHVAYVVGSEAYHKIRIWGCLQNLDAACVALGREIR